jgi:hypothetical protein
VTDTESGGITTLRCRAAPLVATTLVRPCAGAANPDAPAGFLDSYRVAKLSRRKPVGFFQRAALVGFQGNLLSQHDVACDQVFIRHETQPRCRPGVIV